MFVSPSVLDASGKLPEGILSGTLSSLGAYDECLETKLGGPEDVGPLSRPSTGQYCSIDIKPFLPPKPKGNSLDRIFNEAADAKGFPKVRMAFILHVLKSFYRRITCLDWLLCFTFSSLGWEFVYPLRVRLTILRPSHIQVSSLNFVIKILSFTCFSFNESSLERDCQSM